MAQSQLHQLHGRPKDSWLSPCASHGPAAWDWAEARDWPRLRLSPLFKACRKEPLSDVGSVLLLCFLFYCLKKYKVLHVLARAPSSLAGDRGRTDRHRAALRLHQRCAHCPAQDQGKGEWLCQGWANEVMQDNMQEITSSAPWLLGENLLVFLCSSLVQARHLNYKQVCCCFLHSSHY